MTREVGAICTWFVRLPNERFVSVTEQASDVTLIDYYRQAYLWALGSEQAGLEALAKRLPWTRGAVAVRALP